MTREELVNLVEQARTVMRAHRRRAESSDAALAARRAAPRNAPSERGLGRGGARAAEKEAYNDPIYRVARNQFFRLKRKLDKWDKENR